MATLVIDGFDKYGPAGIQLPTMNSLLPQGAWSIGNVITSARIVAGLSATGQAGQLGTFLVTLNEFISRTLPGNYSRLIGGFRFVSDLEAPVGCCFVDNFTPQCSIVINAVSGIISINRGQNGTILQIGPASVAAGTTHYLEFDITFNSGILGGWVVWLDGVQVLAGTGTTVVSGNHFANVFQFITFTGFSNFGFFTFDDLYIFDSTTAFNNSALLSNPAVITQFPIADDLQQFTDNGNVFGHFTVNSNSAYTMATNTLYLLPLTPNVNCTLDQIVVWTASLSLTAKFAGVVYNDVAGAPHTLLSDGTEVIGCAADSQLFLPLTSPTVLLAGQQYWLGLITDSSLNYNWFDGVTSAGFRVNNTYTLGAPPLAPTMLPNQRTLAIAGYCTGAATNWQTEALNPPIGDLSSVSSAVPGTEDLYQFPALPANVVQVYTVGISGNCRLTFPGTHTFDLVIDSSGTLSAGSNPNIAPTTNYAWYDSYNDADPHTSAAWLPNAVTVSFSGMEIVT